MYEIKMPRLSDSMEVGQIVEWKVEEGDEVQQGQNLADIESDKATMELECFHDGTIAKIMYAEGEEVEVGEIIAYLAEPGEEEEAPAEEEAPEETPEEEEAEPEEPGEEEPEEEAVETPAEVQEEEAEEEVEAGAEPEAAGEEGERVRISPYARKLAEEHDVDYSGIEGSGPDGRIIARDIKEATGGEITDEEESAAEKEAAEEGTEKKEEASAEPLAEVLAEQYGVDLSRVTGSGIDGRITADDVLSARGAAEGAETEEKEAAPSPEEELPELKVDEDEAEVEEAPFRLRTQARHVIATKHAVPHFYVTRGADVTDLIGRKDDLKENYDATLTHVIMLASVRALAEHPDINRSYDRGRIIDWNNVNLGLAVNTPKGLTVAVLQKAEELGLQEISDRTSALVEKAREGNLSPEERRHPTFVITNLGMFDVEEFQAILNPPAAVTVAVSSALPTPVVRDGEVEAGTVMKLTLSCDHRIVDGVGAAKFLRTLKDLLEDPESLLDG
jgi:pyruvate dehydrogenase E2 component (dihydrolipoamide acetyltransferase)